MQTQRKRRIGILGGSFDPPTLGHIQLAAEAINLRIVHESWIIPCGQRKDKNLSPGKHRLNMLENLVKFFFKADFPVKVKDYEIKKGEHIPTYTLMKDLTEEFKEYDFYFILGSDLLADLDSWKYAEKLKNEIKFVIFLRMGYKLNEEVLPKFYIIENTSFAASSSSEIRSRIRALRRYGLLDPESIKKEKELEKSKKENKENKKENPNKTDDKEVEVNRKALSDSDGFDSDSSEKESKKVDVVKLYDLGKIKLSTCKLNLKHIDIERRHKTLEREYLGIYGIVPNLIIQYIKENNLYND